MNKKLVMFLTLGILLVGYGSYSIVAIDEDNRVMENPYEVILDKQEELASKDTKKDETKPIKEEVVKVNKQDKVATHKNPVVNTEGSNSTSNKPTVSLKPSNPVTPGESNKPNIPSIPLEPSKPVIPGVVIPSIPLEPSKPSIPSIPLEPSKPIVPGEEKPGVDEKPSIPNKPSEDKPSTPNKPSVDKPSKPNKPNKPNKPSEDEKPSIPPTPPTGGSNMTNVDAMVQQVLDLVNQERAKQGLSSLTLDVTLQKSAMAKSKDMAINNYFDHNSPTYGSVSNMLNNFGIKWRANGENIAKGQTSAAQVMNSWMNSSGHRANILKSGFTHIGIGIYKNANGQILWTQQFITK